MHLRDKRRHWRVNRPSKTSASRNPLINQNHTLSININQKHTLSINTAAKIELICE